MLSLRQDIVGLKKLRKTFSTFSIQRFQDIKAFYMRQNDDGKTVAAMDMLVPKVIIRCI